jgi:xanthine dehydrogenase accessory factor
MQAYELIRAVAEGPGGVAFVTVRSVLGSAPRHLGAKMLVLPDGQTLGTVGGGAVEAKAYAASRACIARGESETLAVELLGEKALGSDPICGGTVGLSVEYVADPVLYRKAWELLDRGGRVILVYENEGGSSSCRAVLDDRGNLVAGANFPLDDAALVRVVGTGRYAVSEADGRAYDPIDPPDRLLILGGGHVGQALARFALPLGFLVCVGDFRPEYASPDRFPQGVETRCGDFTEIVADYPFGLSTYVVVVSPGHEKDMDCVRAILAREYKYAGCIGSRRKTRMILDQMIAEGFESAKVKALRAPIGADIGAETPEEIAVAILAEIIAVRRGSPAAAAMDADRERRRA